MSIVGPKAAASESAPRVAIAVLGAGTMGAGIAALAALLGHPVLLFDAAPGAVEAARTRIDTALSGSTRRGKATTEEARAALDRVRAVGSPEEAARGAGVVIEAVPEKIELKQAVLRQAAATAAPCTLFATNTSSLSVTEIAAACPDPTSVIGMHFFNPPLAMPLVEIVRGERSAEETIRRAQDLASGLGKETIVVRDSPGFATSRLGIALANEAMRMLETGVATAEAIDRAMELGYRHPMGPLRLSDLVGLDVRLAIAEHLHRELGSSAFRPPQILRRLVRAGKLGRKTGEGFYRYDRAEGE